MTATLWLERFSQYEREFKKWEARVTKILKKYRDDSRNVNSYSAKFNILWSNVQTIVPATYSRLPKPDVSRRFRDNDPVGRVASLLLERALDFEIQHYPDYRSTMKESVMDRFLGGRGTSWARYEPHFKNVKMPSGVSPSEDVDESNEELDYECAPVDYVHWRDFGHQVARTWEEVGYVWRKLYLTRAQLVARFGDEGKKIPLDSKPDDQKDKMQESDLSRGLIYEVWDKESDKAIWVSKSLTKIIDERDDPLGLEGFFPCPKPLFATLTSDSLVPVPDYTLYQDQAQELDTLCDRIDGLTKALQVKGVYNAEIPELSRLFTEGTNNTLIPAKNWAAFSEKNGLAGAIDLVDLTPIAKALEIAYNAMDQIKAQIYEITGISDIIRGATDPRETLGAQEMKGQYATLRLKDMQTQVSQYATELLQIKAQIICGKFSPETILRMSAAEQLLEADKVHVPEAMQLLLGERAVNPDLDTPNPLRAFRIEVAADSLVQIDEQAEKQARVEFLTATGTFLKEATVAAQTAPELVPLLMEMLKFGVTGFKVGKTIEGSFDETAERLKQAAANPKPDPEAQKLQAEAQMEQQRAQAEAQKAQMDMQIKQIELQNATQSEQTNAQLAQIQEQNKRDLAELQAQVEQAKIQSTQAIAQMTDERERWKSQLDAAVKLEIASLGTGENVSKLSGDVVETATKQIMESLDLGDIRESLKGATSMLTEIRTRKPARIERDAQGNPIAVGDRKVLYENGNIAGLQ